LAIFGRHLPGRAEQVHANLLVRKFAAAEPQRDLHLVAFADELVDRPHLHVIVMIVDVRTHLDLLDLLRLLALAGEVGLFLRLVPELADVEELADRRIGVGRDLDQIEANSGRLLDRLAGVHDAQILAILVDHAHLWDVDHLVVARPALDGGRHHAPGWGSYCAFSCSGNKKSVGALISQSALR
jgi:hypothetical protein